jgi:hypothetical protein
VSALPVLSTATQKVDAGAQETEVSGRVLSTPDGEPHAPL